MNKHIIRIQTTLRLIRSSKRLSDQIFCEGLRNTPESFLDRKRFSIVRLVFFSVRGFPPVQFLLVVLSKYSSPKVSRICSPYFVAAVISSRSASTCVGKYMMIPTQSVKSVFRHVKATLYSNCHSSIVARSVREPGCCFPRSFCVNHA